MIRQLRPAIVSFVLLTVITGIVYPAVVTGIAHLGFPHQATGSLIDSGGKRIGSELIGQPFSKPEYFWSRPSATTPAYNAASGAGSNLAPSNPDLAKQVSDRVTALKSSDPVPVDLVTNSASGLDPHISRAAARCQIARVARARRLSIRAVEALVSRYTEPRTVGLLGEDRVNVLLLNLALDRHEEASTPPTTKPGGHVPARSRGFLPD